MTIPSRAFFIVAASTVHPGRDGQEARYTPVDIRTTAMRSFIVSARFLPPDPGARLTMGCEGGWPSDALQVISVRFHYRLLLLKDLARADRSHKIPPQLPRIIE